MKSRPENREVFTETQCSVYRAHGTTRLIIFTMPLQGDKIFLCPATPLLAIYPKAVKTGP